MSVVTHLLLEVMHGPGDLCNFENGGIDGKIMVTAINLSMWCDLELSYRITAAVNFIRIFPTVYCGIHASAWCALEDIKPYSRAE